jgi:hypothetical protein
MSSEVHFNTLSAAAVSSLACMTDRVGTRTLKERGVCVYVVCTQSCPQMASDSL